MTITYIAHTRFPNERAHGHQMAHVCAAMAGLGHSVTIVAPGIATSVTQDAHAYYHLPDSINLVTLPQFDAFSSRLIPEVCAFAINMRLYARHVRTYLATHASDVVYLRSPVLLEAALSAGTPVMLELHSLPRRGKQSFVAACNRCANVVCLTTPMRDALVQWGVAGNLLMTEGDAVDIAAFRQPVDRPATRQAYHIPMDVPLIGFAGQLKTMGLSKGVEVLLEALQLLAQRTQPFHAVIAGGPDEERRTLQHTLSPSLAPHVTFTGHLAHAAIPALLQSCDVLVYPAPASDHSFYRRDTSPLKLYEYLAAGVPLVSADLPPLRDILDESTALMVPPGDASALADAIQRSLQDPDAARLRANRGKERVSHHTWKGRMGRILMVRG